MRDEIRQNGEPLLWAEGEEWTSIPMIFQNITGKNFTGQEYRAYIENWILHQGFELGPVEGFRRYAGLHCRPVQLR